MKVTPSLEVSFIPPTGEGCAEWERPVGHLLGGGSHRRPDSGIAFIREKVVGSVKGASHVSSLAGYI